MENAQLKVQEFINGLSSDQKVVLAAYLETPYDAPEDQVESQDVELHEKYGDDYNIVLDKLSKLGESLDIDSQTFDALIKSELTK